VWKSKVDGYLNHMSHYTLSLILLVGSGLSAGCCHSGHKVSRAAEDRPADPIQQTTTADLTARPPVGRLGLPLGTVAEVRATVVRGGDTYDKFDVGRYLLRVSHVNGRALSDQPLLIFYVGPGRAGLAPNVYDLYELKHGAKVNSLDSGQVAELEAGYVGREVRLAAYETGRFGGVPRNLEGAAWQDVAFGFQNWLEVVGER